MADRSTSIIGIDLGGTKIALARYALMALSTGNALTSPAQVEERVPTHVERGFDHVLQNLITMAKKMQMQDTVGVGIGVPGLVRQPQGHILRLPNVPGGDDFPLREKLEQQLQLPVCIDNDANCFALAEAVSGAGKGHRVVVGITLGTGVGGGIVVDRRIYHGSSGFAGEVGHMLLRPGEPPYKTENNRGEVEQFFSGTAMGKRCTAAKRPEYYLAGEVCAFLRPEIFREIAWMCTNLVHLLDPSVIIFGGRVGRAFQPYLGAIQAELQQWLLPGTPLPRLAVAMLQDAATRGAALLVQHASPSFNDM